MRGETLIPRSEPATQMLHERRVNYTMREKDGTVDEQGTKSRRNCEVPFIWGKFGKTVHDPVPFLRILGSVIVSKVRGWKDPGGALYDDVVIFTRDDAPLTGLVSDRQLSLSESDVLPAARGQIEH